MSARDAIAGRLTGANPLRLSWPPVGRARWGDLRRIDPAGQGQRNGAKSSQPIVEHYTREFLRQHAGDVRGEVLELGSRGLTGAVGGNRVDSIDTAPAQARPHDRLTLAATTGTEGQFDCILAPHALQWTYELEDAAARLSQVLRPGGVLLATLPGIGQVRSGDKDEPDHYWSFTSQSATELFARAFSGPIETESFGNVLATVAALHGIDSHELDATELATHDPDYELVIGVRATRTEAG